MSQKTKFALISILTSFAFWIPIFSLYMETRGISAQQIYTLLTIYSFAVVILEYPTGVFGDLFSHKLSTLIGYGIYFFLNIIVFLYSGFPSFVVYILIASLSVTFISGSDAAFRFASLKETFKKDYPTIKLAGTIATLVGIAAGPLLYGINVHLPFIVNGICFGIAFLIAVTIPYRQQPQKKDLGNAFSIALGGLKNVKKSPILGTLLVSSAIIGTIAINMKWIYPMLFSNSGIPVGAWGILISSLYLARMLGTMLYKKFQVTYKREMVFLLLLATVLLLLGVSQNMIFLYVLLSVQFFIVGLLETSFDVDILHNTEEHVRASVLSLSSLVERLMSGIHLGLLGALASGKSVWAMAIITTVFVLLALASLAVKQVFQKRTVLHTQN